MRTEEALQAWSAYEGGALPGKLSRGARRETRGGLRKGSLEKDQAKSRRGREFFGWKWNLL